MAPGQPAKTETMPGFPIPLAGTRTTPAPTSRPKNNVGSPLPPVTLRLKLTSLLNTTALVEVVDFSSDLGNFAVYPSILALAPNQTAEPEPMISQLGVTSDEIPVKVSLRLEKKLESRTIMVKNLLDQPSLQQ